METPRAKSFTKNRKKRAKLKNNTNSSTKNRNEAKMEIPRAKSFTKNRKPPSRPTVAANLGKFRKFSRLAQSYIFLRFAIILLRFVLSRGPPPRGLYIKLRNASPRIALQGSMAPFRAKTPLALWEIARRKFNASAGPDARRPPDVGLGVR